MSYPLTLHFTGSEQCHHGHAFGPATRDHFLFHFVTEGCGIYEVNNRKYEIHKNEGFMIFPGDTTYYKADDLTPWTYHWISFSGQDAARIVSDCGLNYNNHHSIPTQGALTAQIITTIASKATYYTNDVSSKYEQVSDLYKLFSTMSINNAYAIDLEPNYAKQAATYIEENYAYAIKILDLARHIGLERSYLYRLFVEAYGLSPKEYLTHYRLQKAKALLEDSRMPIEEIAYSVGFGNNTLFYRHFSDAFDTTPKKYRQSCRS